MLRYPLSSQRNLKTLSTWSRFRTLAGAHGLRAGPAPVWYQLAGHPPAGALPLQSPDSCPPLFGCCHGSMLPPCPALFALRSRRARWCRFARTRKSTSSSTAPAACGPGRQGRRRPHHRPPARRATRVRVLAERAEAHKRSSRALGSAYHSMPRRHRRPAPLPCRLLHAVLRLLPARRDAAARVSGGNAPARQPRHRAGAAADTLGIQLSRCRRQCQW
jgi:hypothetical protein